MVRARSWVAAARRRELRLDALLGEARAGAPRMWRRAIEEARQDADAAWLDAVVALLRALL